MSLGWAGALLCEKIRDTWAMQTGASFTLIQMEIVVNWEMRWPSGTRRGSGHDWSARCNAGTRLPGQQRATAGSSLAPFWEDQSSSKGSSESQRDCKTERNFNTNPNASLLFKGKWKSIDITKFNNKMPNFRSILWSTIYLVELSPLDSLVFGHLA